MGKNSSVKPGEANETAVMKLLLCNKLEDQKKIDEIISMACIAFM
jgi:hypothetical protein